MKDIGETYYNGNYHKELHHHLVENDEYFSARAHASQKRLLKYIELENRKLLDYGCGIGQNIFGIEGAAGYDISSFAREQCTRRGVKVFDSLESIPVDFWDILFCSHALEHFESPLQHLEIMKNLLRDNGLLVLVVPKEGHVKDGVHNDFDIHQHLYCWNLRSLANLVTRAGFIVLNTRCVYTLGYRVLLPIHRLFGFPAYYFLSGLMGWISNCGHLIVIARKENDDCQDSCKR